MGGWIAALLSSLSGNKKTSLQSVNTNSEPQPINQSDSGGFKRLLGGVAKGFAGGKG